MITTLILVALLGAYVYMAVQIEPFISNQTITCYCGKRRTYRYVITDSIEIKRIAQTLSEGCDVCQYRAGREDLRIEGPKGSAFSLQPSAVSHQPSAFSKESPC